MDLLSLHTVDWLHLCLRWIHLIAGIAWIGNSFYFMWLDSHLESEQKIWMVHGGGYYQVEKRKMKPGEMPDVLHWFKWEATFTWLSGILLLSVVYYLGHGIYLIDPSVSSIGVGQACLVSIGSIIITWLVYDSLWQSSIAQKKPGVATALSLCGLVFLGYGLCHTFSGRAAFIHMGAILGTIMVANVWIRILPAQSQMILETKAGRIPDELPGKKAKRRSTHNSYMTLPVLFLMLSNHFPNTYGHSKNWVILGLFLFVGASVRHVMLQRAKKVFSIPGFASALVGFVLLFYLTSPASYSISNASSANPATGADHSLTSAPVSFKMAKSIIERRCISCHSKNPSDDVFRVPPKGVVLDSPKIIQKMAERIKSHAVQLKTMPLGNKTGMTELERAQLSKWIDQGASID